MNKFYLAKLKITLFLFTCLFCSCSTSLATKNSSKGIAKNLLKEIKSNTRLPILEIWKVEEGSVPIRGEHLHFRLYDDGYFDFDYLTSKIDPDSKRFIYSFRRVSLAKLTKKEFNEFKSVISKLTKDKNVKNQYPKVSSSFDVTIKLKILLIENSIIKKKIITKNSDIVIMKKSDKFPKSLNELVKKIYMVRLKLTENKKDK